MCHNSQPIPTGMYCVLSISSSPPFLWMTTFQQHNIPQKCWYTHRKPLLRHSPVNHNEKKECYLDFQYDTVYVPTQLNSTFV